MLLAYFLFSYTDKIIKPTNYHWHIFRFGNAFFLLAVEKASSI